MNNFVKLSEVKVQKMKIEEMKKTNGGCLLSLWHHIRQPVLMYGVITSIELFKKPFTFLN